MRFVYSKINDFKSREHDPVIPSSLLHGSESKPIV